MFTSLIDYTTAVIVTIMLLVVIGALFVFALAFWSERKRTILAHEETLAIAEIEASKTHLSELQLRILAQHYCPEMEIIYAHALEFGREPSYLAALEAFREDYPQAYALWTRHRGVDSTLDAHVASYAGWDEVQA